MNVLDATYHSAAIIKNIVACIKELVDEGNFTFEGKEGLTFESLDSSNVAFIKLHIPADAFSDFKCARSVTLGLNIKTSLNKVLANAPDGSKLRLVASEKLEELIISYENDRQSKFRHYQVNLIEINCDQMKIPELDTKCEIKMLASEFKRMITELVGFGDTCKITCKAEGVSLHTAGDVGKANISLKNEENKNDKDAVTIKASEELSQTFALRYLAFMAKAANISHYVTIKMTPDNPLVLVYHLDASEDPKFGHLTFCLAPKEEISE